MPPPTDDSGRSAAFFDVDGTLTKTNIVHYYIYFRRRRMTRLAGGLWQAAFMLKCLYYLVLDKIDRSMLNVVFYRSYAGMRSDQTRSMVPDCHRHVIEPRRFTEAQGCIEAHRAAGRRIVLVTGSIDFIIAPLAESLRVKDILAPALIESEGRFTGELDGPPVGNGEKARRIERFARLHDIDLSRSFAYGDSIADLPMLEAVGHPQAVNPDRALEKTARQRGWPVHRWTIADPDVAPVSDRCDSENAGR